MNTDKVEKEGVGVQAGVSFDEALKTLGKFGRYQRTLFFLMCLLPLSVGIQTLFTVFTMATPKFRCALPGVDNDTYSWHSPDHDELLNVSMPWEEDDDDRMILSHCQLYKDRNLSEAGHLLPNRSTEACHRWVYDHSVFTSTFTEDENLVCSHKEDHANADMLYMVGVLVGSFIVGLISDRFGRKTALMLSVTLHIGCAVATAFAQSFVAFVTLRFFLGVANLGTFLTAYVTGLEMVGDSVRTVAGSVMQMFWPVGLFILDGVAYGVRDWRHLQLIMSCPAALFLSYFFLVKESPRWLASRGRYQEANAIMQHAAKVNGVQPPPAIGDTDSDGQAESDSPLRMFTNRTTLIRTLIIYINWVMVTMIYYGLSLNVGSLGGNIYLNFFLSSVAELVGYVLSMIGLDRLGRKVMHCGSMILAGLACLATMIPVIMDVSGKDTIVLVLSNVGKLGASSAFSIIYLFSAELFPTVVRNSMMGTSSMLARIGGIASPYIAQLNVIVGGSLGVALPLVVFGGCGLLAGLLALILPETLGRPLPATVEDAINMGKKDSKKSGSKYSFDNKAFN